MSELTKCVCGHEIAYHSENGCNAYVRPEIGGSGICCTRTADDIVRGLLEAAEQERDEALTRYAEREGRWGWALIREANAIRDAEAAEKKLVALDRANGVLIEARDHAYQRVAELEAEVLALADEAQQRRAAYPKHPHWEAWKAHEADLRTLVSDTTARCPDCGPGYRHGDEGCRHTPPATALDRVRKEAVEAALALIEEVLSRQEEWARASVLDISGRVGEERRTSGKATLMNIEEVRTALAIAREATAR